MGQQLSIPDIIDIGDISVSLALGYQQQGALFGPRKTYTAGETIALVTDALRWQYQGNPADATLRGVANYLYWLCGKFALEGLDIINGPGGGAVIPINPALNPNPIEFEVTVSSFMVDGQSVKSIQSFVGYNLLFVRNNIPQSIVDMGGSYFSWDKTTGIFTCYPAAVSGELFQLYPFI